MEADWEFEVGGDAPVIDATWAGLLDLRAEPERANELAEVAEFPALGRALARLNDAGSPVWTSKCDFWPVLDQAEFNGDELDAPPGRTTHAMGCYIDLMSNCDGQWISPATVGEACRLFCARLHAVPLRCCRADLVIRRAIIAPEQTDFGITAYLTSCGGSAGEAAIALEAALNVFAGAILGTPASA
ncbi:MAG: hypothetical protein ABR976_19530 [Terracidiphilus sp.]|jgi:hypothetical protein